MTEATIAHAQKVIAEKGSDGWWQLPIEDLLPEELRSQAAELTKGEDTMVHWPYHSTSELTKGDTMVHCPYHSAGEFFKGEGTMVLRSYHLITEAIREAGLGLCLRGYDEGCVGGHHECVNAATKERF
jgi:isoleucyl-tRNA synthetase